MSSNSVSTPCVPLKVVLRDDIRRISRDSVSTYNALIEYITKAFGSKLPLEYTLKFEDEEGDKITVTEQCDYEEVFRAPTNKTAKIFVIPTKGHGRCRRNRQAQSSEKAVEVLKQSLSTLSKNFGNVKVDIIDETCKPVSSSHPKMNPFHNAFCDECQKSISGVRFKCGNCPDFDLCETCEAKPREDTHDPNHIFLKIYKPFRGFGNMNLLSQNLYTAPQFPLRRHFDWRLPRLTRNSVLFAADVTIPDGSEVQPGSVVEKTWRFLNASKISLDKLTVAYVCGDALKEISSSIVAVEEEESAFFASIIFESPSASRKYRAYYRLKHNGQQFGPRFWLDFVIPEVQTDAAEAAPVETVATDATESTEDVTEATENVTVETDAVEETAPVETDAVEETAPVETDAVEETAPVEAEKESAVPEPETEAVVEESPASEIVPEETEETTIESEVAEFVHVATPAETEVEAEESMADSFTQFSSTDEWRAALEKLEEMGFKDRSQNIAALYANNGDVVRCIQHLLSQ